MNNKNISSNKFDLNWSTTFSYTKLKLKTPIEQFVLDTNAEKQQF